MPDDYSVHFHPEFFDDLKRLDRKEKEIISKQVEKIKRDPTRFKHLRGGDNCYRVRMGNLRLVYYLEGKALWFLVAERRDTVYSIYLKRLYNLKQRLESEEGAHP